MQQDLAIRRDHRRQQFHEPGRTGNSVDAEPCSTPAEFATQPIGVACPIRLVLKQRDARQLQRLLEPRPARVLWLCRINHGKP
jgi:hypothetical protein